MKIRAIFGIDAFELVVQLLVTGILIAWVNAVNRSQDAEVFTAILTLASLVTLSIRRRLALRSAAPTGLTTGEVAAERIAELEERLAELEAGQSRIGDLEERLDFAERLLAQGNREPEQVGPGDRRV